MPSLNAKRRASELLRQAAQARLSREAASLSVTVTDKPLLHLFKEVRTPPPPAVATEVQVPLEGPSVPVVGGGALEASSYVGADGRVYDGERADARYRWRVRICRQFAMRYGQDAATKFAAGAFAYGRRAMIHRAFDEGRVKEAVLAELKQEFEAVTTIQA